MRQLLGVIAVFVVGGRRRITFAVKLGVVALATVAVAGAVTAAPALTAGDFQIALTPSARSLTGGASTTYTVQVASIGGFTSPVTLSIPTLPSGVTAKFSTNPVTPTATSTLTVTTTATTPAGAYSLPVTGTGGGITHVAKFDASLDFALTPNPPPPPPCPVAVEGTVTDAQSHAPLAGASVNSGAATTDTTGHYRITQTAFDDGSHKASVPVFVTLDPDYWFNVKTPTPVVNCGATLTGQDVTLLHKIRFTISGKVVEGTADASTNWQAVKKVPEVPIASAAVTAWTFCDLFGNDRRYVRTATDGVSPRMTWDLSYNNTPKTIFSFASLPELGLPDGCPPRNPYPPTANPKAIGGYWWSDSVPSAFGQQPDADTASASNPINLDIVKQFLLVKKCASSVTGTVVYNDTGLPAAGVSIDASTLGSDAPYRDGWDAATDAHTAVVSDANGHFAFPTQSLRLWHNNQPTDYSVMSTAVPDAGHKNWAGSQTVRLAGNCADRPSVTVRLKPPTPPTLPGAIEGHLYDETTGNPVVGKQVCANFLGPCVATDSTGFYRLANLLVSDPNTPTTYELSAPGIFGSFAPDYWQSFTSADVASGKTTTGVNIRVLHKRFASISGVVRDPTTGLAVPSATVSLTPADGHDPCPSSPGYCVTTYDGKGGYRIDHVELNYRNASGTATLDASADGYQVAARKPLATFTVSLAAGVDTVQNVQLIKIVVCSTTATVSGTVTNAANGAPIAAATVSYPEYPGLSGPLQTSTNAQGKYVLAGIPVSTNFPEQATLTAVANGFQPLPKSVTLACGAALTVGSGPPPPPHPPNIFEVDLYQCKNLHVGYNYFPANTVVHWNLSQAGVKVVSNQQFTTLGGGRTYHFLTMPLGVSLQPEAMAGEQKVRFSWTINGVLTSYKVQRDPGC